MFTSRLAAINAFSKKFEYLHGRKYQNNFGSMSINSFYEIVFPLTFSYFTSKNHHKFEFFKIAREICKSDFFAISAKGWGKVIYEVVEEVTG